MSRKLIAVALTLAMPVAAVCAPLVHAHLDDDVHGHRIHAHLSGHASDHDEAHRHSRSSEEPALAAEHHDDHHDAAATLVGAGDSSERATSVPLYVAVQKDVRLQPVLPPASFAIAAPLRSVLPSPPDVVRSHGPPVVRLNSSRAPPSLAA